MWSSPLKWEVSCIEFDSYFNYNFPPLSLFLSLSILTVLKGLFSRKKKFEADHPFAFAVRYKDSIVFMGHIANYAYV